MINNSNSGGQILGPERLPIFRFSVTFGYHIFRYGSVRLTGFFRLNDYYSNYVIKKELIERKLWKPFFTSNTKSNQRFIH